MSFLARERRRVAILAILLAPALARAAAAAEVVDVHAMRHELWAQATPRTAEDIKKLKELAITWENISRRPVLEAMDEWLKANGAIPPTPSGTLPHTTGSSGLLTDVDVTFKELEHARKAAARFEELGYTVHWNVDDTFSVLELDYTAFAETRGPRIPMPGSAEEVAFLHEATRFPDKVWTTGSQQWVERIKINNTIAEEVEKAKILRATLEESVLTGSERAVLKGKLAEAERGIAALTERLKAVQVTDQTGFVADMFKKAIHHMDLRTWCPIQDGFRCWEDPRQASKAAARAVKEMSGPSAEAGARLAELDDLAKGRAVLAGEGAELAAAQERLIGQARSSFNEAWEAAVAADAAFDRTLVAEYEAAVASGDKVKIAHARLDRFRRQMTARRIEETLKGIAEIQGAESSRVVHEWLTGERLRMVERSGKAPVFEVVEETAEGLKVVGTRSAAEVRATTLNAIEQMALRKAGKGLETAAGYRPPSFSSVSFEGKTLAGKVSHVVKSPLTMLLAGYGAYVGGTESVKLLDEAKRRARECKDNPAAEGCSEVAADPTFASALGELQQGWLADMEVLSASDFGDWDNITAKKIGGWATATALGTALAVSELTGFSHIARSAAAAETPLDKLKAASYATCQVLLACLVYEAGQWYSEEAVRIELDDAGRERRPMSHARIVANFLRGVPAERLGERMGQWLVTWSTQRFEDIRAARVAEIEALRREFEASAVGIALEQTLGSGGMDKLATQLSDLRLRTATLRETWRTGTDDLDQAIFWRQEMERSMRMLEPVPDFAERCRALLERLGDDADEEALAAARESWKRELESYAGIIRLARSTALETLANALNAANIFGDAGWWQSELAVQGELQLNLDGRFRRLTLVLPDNEQLGEWRSEIEGMADPVRIELRADLASEGRSMALEAEEVLRKLDGLLALEIPACELSESEESEERPPEEEEAVEEEEPTEEEDSGEEEAVEELTPDAPVLYLVEIEGPVPVLREHARWEIQHQPGAAGFTIRNRKDHSLTYHCEDGVTWGGCPGRERWWRDVPEWEETLASLKVGAFPGRITMGEAFSISADLKLRRSYSRHFGCHRDPGSGEDGVIELRGTTTGLSASASSVESATHSHCDWEAVCGHRGVSAGGERVYGAPCRTGARERDLSISADIHFVPAGVEQEPVGDRLSWRIFSYSAEGGSALTIGADNEARLFRESWAGAGEYESSEEVVVTVGIDTKDVVGARPFGSIRLHYKRGTPEESVTPVPYEHPAELLRPPVDETLPADDAPEGETIAGGSGSGSGGAGDGTGETDTGGAPGGDAGSGSGGGTDGTGGTGTGATGGGAATGGTGGAGASAGLGPNAPEIAGFIRKWLGVAEPPENATLGADLHYNEWGVKLGRVPGGIISGTPGRPDDVGSRTSPEYVWGLRDRLDSVDHCTVGEYVDARLEGGSIAHCAGRYPRTIAVPRVTGLPVAEATTTIGRVGLETRPSLLGPAPSRELANRVAEQRPTSAGRLVRGAAVEIAFYGEYEEPLIVMPDLVGQTETLAEAWLEDLGLYSVIQEAGPAPAVEKVGRVAAQSRPPEARLGPGEAVVLFVYQAVAVAATPTPVPTLTQATCDRSWPGTVLTRDPATGADNCLCPPGTAWSKVRGTCLSLGGAGGRGGAPGVPAADCRHMPGTIRNPATGACTCPVGAWDPARGRCVDTAAADREREITEVTKAASCEKLYSDMILARKSPNAITREMAARAEREARDLGCDAGRIAEATGAGVGGGGGDAPITPVTGPVETKNEGEARVSSRNVNICIIDVNSVLDDHFDLFVNGFYLGSVENPEGGAACYRASLRGGANELFLQLVATRGKGTYLKVAINNDEYQTTFGGSTNHAWTVIAP